MANPNEATHIQPEAIAQQSASLESWADVAGPGLLWEVELAVEMLDDLPQLEMQMMGAEVATRLAEAGVRSPYESPHNPYRVSLPSDTKQRPELVALPFASTGISRYHEMWRLLSARLIGEDRHAVRDWIVDLRTGHCVMNQVVYCEGDPIDARSEPRLDLTAAGISIVEGTEYRKYIQSLTERDMARHNDRVGFMQDTEVFVGGNARPIDMHTPDGFTHTLIS